MEYSVTCACGKQIAVAAAEAGTEISCSCGLSVPVPRLSQLRRSTGQPAYKATVIEAIDRLIREGELPFGDTCALCGTPTTGVVEVCVVCERPWYRPPSALPFWVAILFMMLCFLPALLLWLLVQMLPLQSRILGRDTVVRIPLRVCGNQKCSLRRARDQRKLREVLSTVPIYEQLLEEYPRAYIQTTL